MKFNPQQTIYPIVSIALALALCIGIWVGVSFWTERTLNYWLAIYKGHAIHVPFWLSALTTLLLNGGMLMANVISEIARIAK